MADKRCANCGQLFHAWPHDAMNFQQPDWHRSVWVCSEFCCTGVLVKINREGYTIMPDGSLAGPVSGDAKCAYCSNDLPAGRVRIKVFERFYCGEDCFQRDAAREKGKAVDLDGMHHIIHGVEELTNARARTRRLHKEYEAAKLEADAIEGRIVEKMRAAGVEKIIHEGKVYARRDGVLVAVGEIASKPAT